MKSFLFAALSLVSEFSKDKEQESIHSLEIEKNSTYMIEGKYANINNFWGVSVPNGNSEDYFYTFELEPGGRILKGNTEVSIESLQEGDTLKITYDGSLALEYPPRLNHATKIEVKDEGTNEIATSATTEPVGKPAIEDIDERSSVPIQTEVALSDMTLKTEIPSVEIRADVSSDDIKTAIPSTEKSDQL